jgi:hypothetical protein
MLLSPVLHLYSGIDDLKLASADELASQGHVMSTKFKTASTYGFQPVTVSSISLEIFQIYLHCLRPHASQGRCDLPHHPLWLNWKGDREKGIGRKVQRFYVRTLGLDVTTTRIRSLLETVATELHERGDITLGAKHSIANINGHSSAIVQSHYLRTNMQSSVHQGRQVFEVYILYSQCIIFSILFNLLLYLHQVCRNRGLLQQQEMAPPPPTSDDLNDDDEVDWDLLEIDTVDCEDEGNTFGIHSLSPTPLLVTPPAAVPIPPAAVSIPLGAVSIPPAAENRWAPKPLLHYTYGERHPDYNKHVKRATWTPAEKDWILAWIKAHPDQPTGHARCLKDIQEDPAARAIFHSIHVLDGARLRAGFDAAVKCSAV